MPKPKDKVFTYRYEVEMCAEYWTRKYIVETEADSEQAAVDQIWALLDSRPQAQPLFRLLSTKCKKCNKKGS